MTPHRVYLAESDIQSNFKNRTTCTKIKLTTVTIGFALPATNRGIERKENSGDFGVRTTRGKTNSQLAWQAGKELVTIPRYRICYNWKQYRTQAWTSTV